MPVITEVVVTALIISLIMATLRKLYDWLCSFFAKSNIPMPPAYPLLRHLPYFWEGMNEDRVLMQWAEQFKKEGIFKFDPLLGPPRICVLKEEFVKKILVTNHVKYKKPGLLAEIFPNIRNGLFMSNGKDHALQRKLLNPVFSYSSIIGFVNVFDSNTDNLIQLWKKAMKKSLTGVAEIDVLKDFNKLTLDVIGETAFGYHFNTLISGENRVSQAVDTMLRGKISVMSRFMKRYIPFYDQLPIKRNKVISEATEVTKSIVSEIIQAKRKELENANNEAVLSNDLLAKMMVAKDAESGSTFTDDVIMEQVNTFLVAGHETSSVALTWTFYLLAKHPQIQEKARKEAQTVIGDSKTIGQEKVDKLEYISAVINESLRMYPPASIFIREVVTEDQLGDYKLAKGSFIIIPICSLHHSEENWKNHNQFIPERFLGEQVGNYKFMPFSNGPRNCIGRKFALLEMKVVIAKLLKTFKFELDPNQGKIQTSLRLTLKPEPNPILRISLTDESTQVD